MSQNATVADGTTGREIGDRLPHWLRVDARWHAPAMTFYDHHRGCDTCKTAGRAVGEGIGTGRCEEGKRLAREYARALRAASSGQVR